MPAEAPMTPFGAADSWSVVAAAVVTGAVVSAMFLRRVAHKLRTTEETTEPAESESEEPDSVDPIDWDAVDPETVGAAFRGLDLTEGAQRRIIAALQAHDFELEDVFANPESVHAVVEKVNAPAAERFRERLRQSQRSDESGPAVGGDDAEAADVGIAEPLTGVEPVCEHCGRTDFESDAARNQHRRECAEERRTDATGREVAPADTDAHSTDRVGVPDSRKREADDASHTRPHPTTPDADADVVGPVETSQTPADSEVSTGPTAPATMETTAAVSVVERASRIGAVDAVEPSDDTAPSEGLDAVTETSQLDTAETTATDDTDDQAVDDVEGSMDEVTTESDADEPRSGERRADAPGVGDETPATDAVGGDAVDVPDERVSTAASGVGSDGTAQSADGGEPVGEQAPTTVTDESPTARAQHGDRTARRERAYAGDGDATRSTRDDVETGPILNIPETVVSEARHRLDRGDAEGAVYSAYHATHRAVTEDIGVSQHRTHREFYEVCTETFEHDERLAALEQLVTTYEQLCFGKRTVRPKEVASLLERLVGGEAGEA